jgi:hypothetical protein
MAAAVDPLSVDVDLDLTVDGQRCRVWNEDDRVVVNTPTLAAARSLLNGVDALPLGPDRIDSELTRADLAVEVRVRHAPVARFGAGVEASRLAALAGYDAAVSLRGLVAAAWRGLL